MSDALDFSQMCDESKLLSGLTAQDEATLRELAQLIVPALDGVTDRFYVVLGSVPRTAAFIEGRVDVLKKTHRAWLESLFTRSLDAQYTEWMYQIGTVHVRVQLPVEFMTAGMTLVLRELLVLVGGSSLDAEAKTRASAAIGSVCGFSQLVMQKSYDTGKLAGEVERVLKITGMSRKLFDNLAAAYKE
jgi:hypothetical protein